MWSKIWDYFKQNTRLSQAQKNIFVEKSYEKINNFSDQIPDMYLLSDLKKSDPVSDQTMS